MANIAQVVSPDEPLLAMSVAYRPSAFFLPPMALGFSTEVENGVEPLQRIASPYFVYGSFSTEGPYLEPTVGQIWPR